MTCSAIIRIHKALMVTLSEIVIESRSLFEKHGRKPLVKKPEHEAIVVSELKVVGLQFMDLEDNKEHIEEKSEFQSYGPPH